MQKSWGDNDFAALDKNLCCPESIKIFKESSLQLCCKALQNNQDFSWIIQNNQDFSWSAKKNFFDPQTKTETEASVKEKTFWFLSTVQQETGFSVIMKYFRMSSLCLHCPQWYLDFSTYLMDIQNKRRPS